MTEQNGFTLEVIQNEELPRESRTMDAVVMVTANGLGGEPAGRSRAAEIIVVDCSGSMDMPRAKIRAARQATRAAIDALRDDVLFGIVAGREFATLVYPSSGELTPASRATRADAHLVVDRLVANGGTAIGSWLGLADEVLGRYPDAVRHVMLFTDGRNEHETPEELTRILDQVRGRFVCDVRGIGDAWEPKELKRIVSVLNGQARGVAEFAGMKDDFSALMREAMRKVVPDVDLRLRMLGGARLRYLTQLFPTMVDLTDQLVREDELTMRLPTGAWADGTREYQVGLEVDATGKPIGVNTAAARVELDIRGAAAKPVPQAMVLVKWTDEPSPATEVPAEITRGIRQQQLTKAVEDGCAAARNKSWQTAEERFGVAVRIATQIDNQVLLDALSRVVEILDAKAGRVRLTPEKVRLVDLKGLEVISEYSTREDAPKVTRAAAGPPLKCPVCGFKNDPDARQCERCRHKFETDQSS